MARKEKKYHFIYKTTNLLSGKYYIGMHSTDNLDDDYLGSGKRLRYSINKYGKENHKREILEYLPNRKSLIMRETEIVSLNEIAKVDCMNLMIGGQGGFISKEQQHYRAICAGKASALKYRTDVAYRKRQNKVVAENMRKAHKDGKIKYDTFTGRKHSEASKKKIGLKSKEYQLGNKNSQYGTMWITDGLNNKKIKKDTEIPEGWYRGRNLK